MGEIVLRGKFDIRGKLLVYVAVEITFVNKKDTFNSLV